MGLICYLGIVGAFMLLLVVSEFIFNLVYRFVPPFHKWFDRFADHFPDWND